ncbi:MAG: imidazole glycerol phosphate synthase subunit HisH [Vampirovibrionales bacterium]|nr:imidazole glycerol phosphate synthase subunit HisH [Vampirovibrionales bacterium]
MSSPAKKVDVVDYGGGNIGSILRCLDRLGFSYRLTKTPDGKTPLILPGVGAFGSIMGNLAKLELKDRLRDIVKSGTPYLGICIGLQVLFEGSEEAPAVEGLNILPGRVVKFKSSPDNHSAIKIPQIGWNWVQSASEKFKKDGWRNGYVYFVNSYYPAPENEASVLYRAAYGESFAAAVQHENVTAFQFHPEKSGAFGQSMIDKWHETLALH